MFSPETKPITMNSDAASWFMHHLDQGNMKVEHAPDEVQLWLRSLELPFGLLSLLQWDWPQENSFAGPVQIYSSSNLYERALGSSLLSHRLIPIGDGPNGDTFAIDFSVDSCPVGFVTHEEYDEKSDPKPFFQPAARSLESFLYRVTEGRYVPCDYYATKALNSFLMDEATHEPYPPYRPRKAEENDAANG